MLDISGHLPNTQYQECILNARGDKKGKDKLKTVNHFVLTHFVSLQLTAVLTRFRLKNSNFPFALIM